MWEYRAALDPHFCLSSRRDLLFNQYLFARWTRVDAAFGITQITWPNLAPILIPFPMERKDLHD